VTRDVGVTCHGDQYGGDQQRRHQHHAERDDHGESVLGAQAALRASRESSKGVSGH
jgi:hypothetical protein